MKNSEAYDEFWASIANKKLKEKLQQYSDRLHEVHNDEKVQSGILIGSKIREITQRILFESDATYIWLPPLETSINEYSKENFVAFNPYANKSYSLVQSPQIQKEAAATLMGTNFRIVDCYRGEKTDATHSNLFQQIDIEFANKSEKEIRGIAKKIVETCFREIIGITLNIDEMYSYERLVRLYGTDSPNLKNGFLIEEKDGHYSIGVGSPEEMKQILPFISKIQTCEILGNQIFFVDKYPIERVREIRKELVNLTRKNEQVDRFDLLGYWVTDMPFAEKKNGIIRPTHHIMSRPKGDLDEKFSFMNFTDEELCRLECNSFDLLVCTPNRVVEVLGGDERISDFKTQYEAIKRMGYSPEQYAFLLETLKFNDDESHTKLGGFAIGVDRFAQFLSGTNNMKYVQLFPTNLPNGELLHAISLEDMDEGR